MSNQVAEDGHPHALFCLTGRPIDSPCRNLALDGLCDQKIIGIGL